MPCSSDDREQGRQGEEEVLQPAADAAHADPSLPLRQTGRADAGPIFPGLPEPRQSSSHLYRAEAVRST